ncbi:MAG: exodeoxyribonuclease VII small subunit [Candidatus Omnitrophota bacterium]
MKEIAFEKALELLEKIVKDLEEGDLSLEISLKKYEEGINLAQVCQGKLDEAKGKIELLIKKDDGLFETEPFEIEDEKE